MVKKIALGLLVILVVFLGYVSTKPSHFNYEKNALINAPADKIFPLISNFKLGSKWNPYDMKDANMKRSFSGTDGQVGSKMEFDGNSETGSGTLEITNLVPNQSVTIHLHMTKPFTADNTILYQLTPEGNGTRFSWGMSGDGGFMGKLMSTFIDCEKMITKDFDVGFANLQKVMETQTADMQH